MKKQLDTRVLLVYLLNKLKKLDEKETYLMHMNHVCILLSKQILFIQTQERLKNTLICLSPLDETLLGKEYFTKEEFIDVFKSLLNDLKVIETEPYNTNLIFGMDKNFYILSSVRFFVSELCQLPLKPKNEQK